MLTVTIYLYLIARKLFVQQMTISIIKEESMPKKHVHFIQLLSNFDSSKHIQELNKPFRGV